MTDSDIVFDATTHTVTALPFERLVLLVLNSPAVIDPIAFLHTFRRYCQPESLYRILGEALPPVSARLATLLQNCPEELGPTASIAPTVISVVSFVRLWAERHPLDFFEPLPTLKGKVRDFLEEVVHRYPAERGPAIGVIHKLDSLEKESSGPPAPLQVRGEVTEADIIKPGDFMLIDDRKIAQQLVALDVRYFKRVHVSEFRDLRWSKADKRHLAMNLNAFVEYENAISYWIQGMVLRGAKPKRRAEMMAKFCRIKKHLREMHDLGAVMAFHIGLNSNSLSRLKKTMAEFSEADMAAINADKDLLERNQKLLRELSAQATPQQPVIPFIGTVQSDLTFAVDGNDDFVVHNGTKLVNWFKACLVSRITEEILRLQSLPWSVPIVEPLHRQLVVSILAFASFDGNVLYEQSLIVEPKDGTRGMSLSEKRSSILDSFRRITSRSPSAQPDMHFIAAKAMSPPTQGQARPLPLARQQSKRHVDETFNASGHLAVVPPRALARAPSSRNIEAHHGDGPPPPPPPPHGGSSSHLAAPRALARAPSTRQFDQPAVPHHQGGFSLSSMHEELLKRVQARQEQHGDEPERGTPVGVLRRQGSGGGAQTGGAGALRRQGSGGSAQIGGATSPIPRESGDKLRALSRQTSEERSEKGKANKLDQSNPKMMARGMSGSSLASGPSGPSPIGPSPVISPRDGLGLSISRSPSRFMAPHGTGRVASPTSPNASTGSLAQFKPPPLKREHSRRKIRTSVDSLTRESEGLRESMLNMQETQHKLETELAAEQWARQRETAEWAETKANLEAELKVLRGGNTTANFRTEREESLLSNLRMQKQLLAASEEKFAALQKRYEAERNEWMRDRAQSRIAMRWLRTMMRLAQRQAAAGGKQAWLDEEVKVLQAEKEAFENERAAFDAGRATSEGGQKVVPRSVAERQNALKKDTRLSRSRESMQLHPLDLSQSGSKLPLPASEATTTGGSKGVRRRRRSTTVMSLNGSRASMVPTSIASGYATLHSTHRRRRRKSTANFSWSPSPGNMTDPPTTGTSVNTPGSAFSLGRRHRRRSLGAPLRSGDTSASTTPVNRRVSIAVTNAHAQTLAVPMLRVGSPEGEEDEAGDTLSALRQRPDVVINTEAATPSQQSDSVLSFRQRVKEYADQQDAAAEADGDEAWKVQSLRPGGGPGTIAALREKRRGSNVSAASWFGSDMFQNVHVGTPVAEEDEDDLNMFSEPQSLARQRRPASTHSASGGLSDSWLPMSEWRRPSLAIVSEGASEHPYERSAPSAFHPPIRATRTASMRTPSPDHREQEENWADSNATVIRRRSLRPEDTGGRSPIRGRRATEFDSSGGGGSYDAGQETRGPGRGRPSSSDHERAQGLSQDPRDRAATRGGPPQDDHNHLPPGDTRGKRGPVEALTPPLSALRSPSSSLPIDSSSMFDFDLGPSLSVGQASATLRAARAQYKSEDAAAASRGGAGERAKRAPREDMLTSMEELEWAELAEGGSHDERAAAASSAWGSETRPTTATPAGKRTKRVKARGTQTEDVSVGEAGLLAATQKKLRKLLAESQQQQTETAKLKKAVRKQVKIFMADRDALREKVRSLEASTSGQPKEAGTASPFADGSVVPNHVPQTEFWRPRQSVHDFEAERTDLKARIGELERALTLSEAQRGAAPQIAAAPAAGVEEELRAARESEMMTAMRLQQAEVQAVEQWTGMVHVASQYTAEKEFLLETVRRLETERQSLRPAMESLRAEALASQAAAVRERSARQAEAARYLTEVTALRHELAARPPAQLHLSIVQ